MQSERQLHLLFLTQKSTGNAFCQMLFQHSSLERKVLKSVLLSSDHISEIQTAIAKKKKNIQICIYLCVYANACLFICVYNIGIKHLKHTFYCINKWTF